MDKRNSERVQFFNLGISDDIQPIWVFRRTSPDAILGLLIDISFEGAQVVTDKETSISGDTFQLTIYPNDEESFALIVNLKWSRSEGTLYDRSGFAFEATEDQYVAAVHKVLKSHLNGKQWLRCELLGLSI